METPEETPVQPEVKVEVAETIYVKDKKAFLDNKKNFDGFVFWRESDTDKTKVELKIAGYHEYTQSLIATIPD